MNETKWPKFRLKMDTPDHRTGEIFWRTDNWMICDDEDLEEGRAFKLDNIKHFDEWFEEVKESGWWKPKDGVGYFYVNDAGKIVSREGFLSMSTTDDKRVDMGNAFRSKAAAERYRDYLKAIATVRQDEGVIDLQGVGEEYETEDNKYDDFCVYTVAFSLYLRKLVVADADEYISANAIWFEGKEHAQSSLDKHLDEWKIIANYDWSRE